MIADVELGTDVREHGSPPPPAASTLISARFPARPRPAGWLATRQGREQVFDQLTQAPFLLNSVGAQKERRRGLVALLDWLGEQPGASWQERWLASGATPRARAGVDSPPSGCARPAGRRA
jgi:hypothetical protein